MNEQEFKERTQGLALRVIRLADSLPKTLMAQTIGKQVLRSGTSIGANYRAACRGKSKADVIAKLGIVEEETDESIYWLELLIKANVVPEEKLLFLRKAGTDTLFKLPKSESVPVFRLVSALA
jgi:four helix bundle protein